MDEGQGHITNMVWPVFDRTKRNHSAPPRRETDRSSAGTAIDWRFEGVTEKGDDVVYVLRLSAAAAVKGINLVLPWKAEDACPACLGRGRTFTPIFGGSNRYKTVCPKCGGEGVTRYNSTVHLDLTPDMIRQGVVRMKRLGPLPSPPGGSGRPGHRASGGPGGKGTIVRAVQRLRGDES